MQFPKSVVLLAVSPGDRVVCARGVSGQLGVTVGWKGTAVVVQKRTLPHALCLEIRKEKSFDIILYKYKFITWKYSFLSSKCDAVFHLCRKVSFQARLVFVF